MCVSAAVVCGRVLVSVCERPSHHFLCRYTVLFVVLTGVVFIGASALRAFVVVPSVLQMPVDVK